MIPVDFDLCRPRTLAQAVEAHLQAGREGLRPVYLGGGTEIVTLARQGLARQGLLRPGLVIDLKLIPELRVLEMSGQKLLLGAGLDLNRLAGSGLFPLLEKVCQGVADHTVRNTITLGGNLAGSLPYREAALPFLAAGARALLFGPKGSRTVPLADVFRKRLLLKPAEILTGLRVGSALTRAGWYYERRTRAGRVDYPLASICLIRSKDRISLSIGGAFGFPLRDLKAEAAFNDPALSREERPEKALAALSSPPLSDARGSSAYRLALLGQALERGLKELGG